MRNYWLKKRKETSFLFELYPDIPSCTVHIIPDKGSGAIILESRASAFAKYTQFIGSQLKPNGSYGTLSTGVLWVMQQASPVETLMFHYVKILMAMTVSNISYLRITSLNYGSLRSNYVEL
jgi:hypothetical protein